MPLKTLVKVGSITNLSDARYCAGMGVDMLGITTLEGQPNYITPKQFQEIRGWVSGPKVVAEIYGLQSASELSSILGNYRPDFLELGVKELSLLAHFPLPMIIRATPEELQSIDTSRSNIAYLQVPDGQKLEKLPSGIPVIIELTATINLQVLEQHPTAGIALNGTGEISPGLKNYDHLADVLEQLEVQD